MMEFALLSILFSTTFLYGIIVGHYRVFPFQYVSKTKSVFESFFLSEKVPEISDSILSEIDSSAQIECHFIDIGEKKSNAFFINVKNGKNCLIDCGADNHGSRLSEYIHKIGVQEINIIILTHYHGDHIGGINDIINEFEIDQVVLPRYSAESKKEELENKKQVLQILNETQIPSHSADVGTRHTLNDEKTYLEILGPVRKYENENNNSTICRFVNSKFSVLFMGDACRDSELDILDLNVELKSDILQVGHHGRCGATTIEFLRTVDPDFAIMSTENRYPKQHNIVTDRIKSISGGAVFRTDEDGTIVIASSNDGYDITNDTG